MHLRDSPLLAGTGISTERKKGQDEWKWKKKNLCNKSLLHFIFSGGSTVIILVFFFFKKTRT